MSNKYLDLLTRIARQPRHASGEAPVSVTLVRSDATTCAAELANFSRGGCQLRLAVQLDNDETVVVRLTDPARGLELALPATIRWRHPDAMSDCFVVGCQFDEEVDYEKLGELFLAGFLSMDT